MYLAGVSVRRVEGITEALRGSKISPAAVSELNKKACVRIEDWRNRPLQGGRYPYVCVDGIYLRRNWGGEYENVAIPAAIAVNEDGFREVLGAAEGMKEDKASWVSFFQRLRGRGLDGVKLLVGDKCMGILEAVGEVFPEAKYQRCTVHFYRNVFSVLSSGFEIFFEKSPKRIVVRKINQATSASCKAIASLAIRAFTSSSCVCFAFSAGIALTTKIVPPILSTKPVFIFSTVITSLCKNRGVRFRTPRYQPKKDYSFS